MFSSVSQHEHRNSTYSFFFFFFFCLLGLKKWKLPWLSTLQQWTCISSERTSRPMLNKLDGAGSCLEADSQSARQESPHLTTASRTAVGPTQSPSQWVPGALSLGVKRLGREADNSPPSSTDVKEWVELYLHSTNAPSWRGAQLNCRDNFLRNLKIYYRVHKGLPLVPVVIQMNPVLPPYFPKIHSNIILPSFPFRFSN
jgi:hypothetical protein